MNLHQARSGNAREPARLQREPRTVVVHETAVLRGPLLRAAIHFAKSPARCLQGPKEVGEHRPQMLANWAPHNHPCQEWCEQHLSMTKWNGRAKLHAANHLSCDNRVASGNHGQAISPTCPTCRMRGPHCTPQSQPTEGQRKCGTCLGGGMCSGSGDSQNLAQTTPQMLIVSGGKLQGEFGTNDPEMIIGTRRSAM